ncbi:MAG TPA: MBL fold metallo-hydrolase [Conexibacter sp.]|jgi:glyoxylase-like metal-dependent hydrolase (beta-lactamase superfamily II)
MAIEIVPLDCGRITQVERSAHQYFTGFGEKVTAQSVLWLIRGARQTIVVDVGSGTPERVHERFGRVFEQSAAQRPRDAVRAAGVDPDEVEVVVQTHLHWDHALSLEDRPFPNARIYLQRSELAYAAAPYPPHAGLYDPVSTKGLLPAFASEYPEVVVIDGDHELDEHIRILHMPGHTPGLQALFVHAGSTRYAIAGDNVPWQSSWSGPEPARWIPQGIHVSLQDCYRSMSRLADVADVVLPSHDECVLGTVYRDGGGA